MENPDLVLQETGDSRSNPFQAGPGSRQTIQAGPDHSNRIDLFATRFSMLPQFVSLVPKSLAWVVDVLSLPWEDLDP